MPFLIFCKRYCITFCYISASVWLFNETKDEFYRKPGTFSRVKDLNETCIRWDWDERDQEEVGSDMDCTEDDEKMPEPDPFECSLSPIRKVRQHELSVMNSVEPF